MSRKQMQRKEKVRILAWWQENVPIKEICRRTRRAKSTIMALLAAARDLPSNSVPPTKPRSGRPRKTSKATDMLLEREITKNPHLTASELKAHHPQLLKDVSVRTIQHRLQKDLAMPSSGSVRKSFLICAMKKGKGSCSKDETQSQGENVPKVKVEVMDGLEDYADPGTSATPSTSSFDVSEQVTTPIPLDSYTNQEEDLGHVSEPSQPSVNGKRETEFDLFGKIIGVQLNNMPLNDALQLQFKIQQVITEFRLNNYRVASSSLHSTQRASARSHVSENASIEDLEIKTEYVSDSFLSD